MESLRAKVDEREASLSTRGELLKDIARKLDVITLRLEAMDGDNNRNRRGDRAGARDRARGQLIDQPVSAHNRRNSQWGSSYVEDSVDEKNERYEDCFGPRYIPTNQSRMSSSRLAYSNIQTKPSSQQYQPTPQTNTHKPLRHYSNSQPRKSYPPKLSTSSNFKTQSQKLSSTKTQYPSSY